MALGKIRKSTIGTQLYSLIVQGQLNLMFLAEFSFNGTAELADELLIEANSEVDARQYAEKHAHTLGLDLFAFGPATQQQIWLYRVLRKFASLKAAQEQKGLAESRRSEHSAT